MGLVATLKKLHRHKTITQTIRQQLFKRRKWMKERLDELDAILEKPVKK